MKTLRIHQTDYMEKKRAEPREKEEPGDARGSLASS